jgi:acyl dehydratase
MPLNPDAVGTVGAPAKTGWTSKDALLYAVSLGFGVNDLPYTTENTNGVTQQVVPTFPVVVGWGAGSALGAVGTFNPAMLVHGQQAVTLHRALPVAANVTVQQKITGMYDKGKAAVVAMETTATDDADGAPVYTLMSSVFIRGEGGWGGDRGPSGPQNVPPDRAADHQVGYQTSVDQALLYRLNGDRNPLHSDPAFAAMGGFERPILHGLCTYGFTGRALLEMFCGGQSSRFLHIEARFTSPVIPGEALTIAAWQVDDGTALFTTSVGDRVVIDQGKLLFAP